MQSQIDRKDVRRRIRYRIRKRLRGSAARPRVAVFRSLKHIYVQAIDDDLGRTVSCASSLDPEVRGQLKSGSNIKAASAVGGALAARLKSAGVETVVFDRGGFLYHGRIKALGDAMREGGLKF
jgi:large subunit ribosomal protein L18